MIVIISAYAKCRTAPVFRAPLAEFAIRSIFVRRTTNEQRSELYTLVGRG
jgi:hypothetical protein